MTSLPILQRELSVWARNRGTYWGRFAVALCGIVVCLPQFGGTGWLGNPATIGKHVFDGLVSAGFLLGCCGCFLTADAISVERREGTLPLLLLTRVKPFDIVMGKLGSIGLASLCSVVALLPLLMLPVLAGGVTGSEVFRKGLACLNTLFFALAVGLYQSATARERFRAGATAGLMLAAFLFLPFATGIFRIAGLPLVLSPLNSVISAGDASYRSQPLSYWASMVVVQMLAWLMLKGAAFRLKRSAGQDAEPAASSVRMATTRGELLPLRTPWHEMDKSPVVWLIRRQRGLRAALWAAALISAIYHSSWTLLRPFSGVGGFGSAWLMLASLPGLAMTLLSGALFAWAASRFPFEARRSGELELLLTTPAGVQTFVSDQWRALKSLLIGPVAVMLLPVLMRWSPATGWASYGVILLLNALNIVLSIEALCWAGMWFGFKARRQTSAIGWTVGLVHGVPFLISMLGMVMFSVLTLRRSWGPPPFSFGLVTLLPQLLILYFYLRLTREAKHRLVHELSPGTPRSFSLSRSLSGGYPLPITDR